MTLDPRPRILIADDDVATAFELDAYLKEAGFQTIGPAVDSQDAIELIACNQLDAVVLDASLVAQAVHAVIQPLTARRTPIVFLSGYRETELPSWAPSAAFCMKPCASSDLVETVRGALKADCPDERLLPRPAGSPTGRTVSAYPPI